MSTLRLDHRWTVGIKRIVNAYIENVGFNLISTDESYPNQLHCVIQPLEALTGLHHDTKIHCTRGYPSPPPTPSPGSHPPWISYTERCVSHLVLCTLSLSLYNIFPISLNEKINSRYLEQFYILNKSNFFLI